MFIKAIFELSFCFSDVLFLTAFSVNNVKKFFRVAGNVVSNKQLLDEVEQNIADQLFASAFGFGRSPINRSLHFPYKPFESTLSDEKLFIEIVFAQNLSRPNA